MWARLTLSLLSFIIALLAIFISLPLKEDFPDYHTAIGYQDLLKDFLKPVVLLFTTCPFHHGTSVSEKQLDPDGIYKVIRTDQSDKIYTKEELSKYDGTEGSLGLYLAILGLVYDVSKGKRFYEPGGGYGFFAGRDGTKAFMTGEFNEKGLVDEVTGLSPPQMLELENWIKFYDENYIYKGRLVGNFYDANGDPTEALFEAKKGILEGHAEKKKKDEWKKHFPRCNSEWAQNSGGSVWCSESSGGDKRDWVGVPRKFFQPGLVNHRCACVRTTGPPFDDPTSDLNKGDLHHPGLQEYEGCPPDAVRCQLKVNTNS